MIFGFNTEAVGKDAVYHVQTEDRGARNPVVDSIIYVGGKIVDRRKTPYAPAEVTQAQIEEMVRKQHKELVDAIRSGAYVRPEGPAKSDPPPPAGYSIQLSNGDDLCRDGQLCFEFTVRENGAAAAAQTPHALKNVSVEARWVVAGAVADSRTVSLGEDGRAELAYPIPPPNTEAVLLLCAHGPAGKGIFKFHARAASEPRL
jgi:hypothetical protein